MNEILAGDQIAIPRGTTVHALVTSSRRAGTFKKPQILLEFNEIVLSDGNPRPLTAEVTRAAWSRPQGEHNNTGRVARSAGKGAASGALMGVIFGGARGAMEGGIAGAALGSIGVLMQHGPDMDFPRGMPFEIELTKPLVVPALQSPHSQVAIGSGPIGDRGDLARLDVPSDERPPRIRRRDSIPVPEQTETAGDVPKDSATVASNRTTPPTPMEPAPRISLPDTEAIGGGYKFKMNVELVVVDATVRDRSGAIVDKLKREDFHLFEDNVEQQITHFSRDELPLAVALVVDRSGSMGPVVDALRRAAYDTLSQLKPQDQVALFAFARTAERLEDLTTDRQRIADDIASISAGGSTDITDALYQAAVYLGRAAPNSRHAIVLVSDNQGTVAGYAGNADVIRMGLETETSIYSIKVGTESFSHALSLPMSGLGTGSVPKIASQTGGEVIDARDPEYVPEAMAAVISRLKQRYSLGYVSSNPRHNGAFRQIVVRVRDANLKGKSDYKIYARSGYYARTEHVASLQ